jgi:hypothetical protein
VGATPSVVGLGAMKMPQGVLERERLNTLEARVSALEKCINSQKLSTAQLAVLNELVQSDPEEQPDPEGLAEEPKKNGSARPAKK